MAKPESAPEIDTHLLISAYSEAAYLKEAMFKSREAGIGNVYEHLRLNELKALGNQIAGKNVKVKAVGREGESPIERYTEINELGVLTAEVMESRFGTGINRVGARSFDGRHFVPQQSLITRRSVTGKVVEADPSTEHLIVRPLGINWLFSRTWVRMIDEDGSPLVSVKFL